jgi:transcriptional regulator with XRE-family HTH domain
VAQRAGISVTWYTWLEQGRGGSPSADVLNRIAKALLLTEAEREQLFLIGLGRLPDVRYRPADGITPRLQRVLDALPSTPAMLRTATWDVVAWNRAAAVVLTDFGAVPPAERNMLRMMFRDPRMREAQFDWEGVARFIVGAFWIGAARAGAGAAVEPLVRELSLSSPEFAAMWREPDLQTPSGEGVKRIRHPVLGTIALESSTFSVDGRPDLQMVVLSPATREDRRLVRELVARSRAGAVRGQAARPEARDRGADPAATSRRSRPRPSSR